jgi:hypothetical protein
MRAGPWFRGLDGGKSSDLPIWKIRKKADIIITSTIQHHHCHLLPLFFPSRYGIRHPFPPQWRPFTADKL